MMRILNNWLSILFILSALAIGSALIAEYFFDLAPCKMCLKQRHPYYVIISLVILFYFFKKTTNIWLFILSQLALLYGLFHAIWHVGIEKKILTGPASCSGVLLHTNSIQNLKEQISNQAVINCSEITWAIAGFSAATVNTFLILLILVFNTIYIFRNFYGEHKKKFPFNNKN